MRKKELLQRGRKWMARFLVICMAAGTFAVLPPAEEVSAASLPSPVLKWDFENATTSAVPDMSGHNRTGAVVNATIVSDSERGGKVADFNGTSAYITGGAGTYAKTTVAFWAKSRGEAPTANGSAQQSYMSADGWETGAAQFLRGKDHLNWCLSGSIAEDGISGANQPIRPNTNYSTEEKNQWVHYAVVYDKEAKKVVGYMNGVQVADLSYTTAVDADLSSFAVGAWKNKTGGFERFINMQMDDFVVYDQTLTANQVQLLMEGGTEPAPASPELVLKWDFEDADNSTVPDVSGNGHTGTVKDAAIVSDSERGSKVADFDGVGSYIAGTAGRYTKTTVAFWAKSRGDAPTAYGSAQHSYLSADGWATAGSAHILRSKVKLDWSLSGSEAADGVSGTNQMIRPNTDYSTEEKDKWVHYAVVYDKETKKVVGYMNGVQVSDQDYTIAVDADLSSFAVGAWKNKTGDYERFTNMQMDDLVIYNGTLSAAEVKKLYDDDEKITTDSAITVDTGAAENVNHILTMIAGKSGYGAANTIIKSERTVADGKKPVYKIDSATSCELYYSSLLGAYVGIVPSAGISADMAKANIEEKDGVIAKIKYGIVGDNRGNRSATGFPDLLYFDQTVLLGKTVPENDLERVLAMDVNGDFKLTVNDLVAIIQNYVYGTDFSVVQ